MWTFGTTVFNLHRNIYIKDHWGNKRVTHTQGRSNTILIHLLFLRLWHTHIHTHAHTRRTHTHNTHTHTHSQAVAHPHVSRSKFIPVECSERGGSRLHTNAMDFTRDWTISLWRRSNQFKGAKRADQSESAALYSVGVSKDFSLLVQALYRHFSI